MSTKYPLSLYSHITTLPQLPKGFKKCPIGFIVDWSTITVDIYGRWKSCDFDFGQVFSIVKSHDYAYSPALQKLWKRKDALERKANKQLAKYHKLKKKLGFYL